MKKILLTISLLFLFFNVVKAEQKNVSISLIPNVYSNHTYNSEFKSSQFGYVFIDDKLTYCLDINKYITTNTYYEYDFSSLSLDIETKNTMELLSYYGYKFNGHNTIRYYMATQELIWGILGVDMYWSTQINGNGDIIDVSEEKNEILNLISGHNMNPYFSEYSFDYRVGNERVMADLNKVLYRYDILNYTNNIITIEDNKLVFKFYDLGPGHVILRPKEVDITETKIYKSDNSQTIAIFGNPTRSNVQDVFISYMIHGGNIYFEKIDYDTKSNIPSKYGKIEGGIYGLYDSSNNLLETFSTDVNGVNSINMVPLGTLTVREIEPSYGYEFNGNEYKTTLSYGDVDKIITFESKILNKNLEIIKMYDEDLCILSKNIKFEIYRDNILFDTMTTDENGYSYIRLPYGEYLIHQVNTVPGYEASPDFIFNVSNQYVETSFILIDKKIKIDEENQNINEDETQVEDTDSNDNTSTLIDNSEDTENSSTDISTNNNETGEEKVIDNYNLSESNEIKELPNLLITKDISIYIISIYLLVLICLKRYCLYY